MAFGQVRREDSETRSITRRLSHRTEQERSTELEGPTCEGESSSTCAAQQTDSFTAHQTMCM